MSRTTGTLLAHLVDNAIWQAIGEAASRLLGLAVTIALARFLGPRDFGIFGAAFALVGYISIVVAAGVDVQGMRSLAREPDRAAAMVGRALAVRLLFAIGACGMVGAFIAVVPLASNSLPVFLVAAIGLFTLAVNLGWVLRALERGRTLAAGLVMQQAVLALLVALAWWTAILDPLSAAAAQIAAEAVLVAWNYRAVKAAIGRIDWSASRDETVALMRASSVLLLGRIPRMLFYNGDLLLVAWLVSAAASGEYLAGQRVVLTFVTVGVLVLSAVFPHSCRLAASDCGRFLEFQAAILRLLMLLLLPVSVLGAFFASTLVVALYGTAYLEAAPVLQLLFVVLPIFVGSLVVQDTLVALHRYRNLALINCGAMLVHLALALALASKLAGVGIAMACLIGETVGLLALGASVWRDPAWSASARSAALKCVLPFVAGAAMLMVLRLTAPVGAVASIALAAGAYLATSYRLRAFSRGEVAALLGAVRSMATTPGRSA